MSSLISKVSPDLSGPFDVRKGKDRARRGPFRDVLLPGSWLRWVHREHRICLRISFTIFHVHAAEIKTGD